MCSIEVALCHIRPSIDLENIVRKLISQTIIIAVGVNDTLYTCKYNYYLANQMQNKDVLYYACMR